MYDRATLLHYAIENGIIDLSGVRDEVEMNEHDKILKQHKSKIWQGKNGRWYTYMPDGKGGRKQVSKSTRQDLEDVIVNENRRQIYNPTVKELFETWVDKKLEYGDIIASTHTRYKVAFRSYFGDFGKRKIKHIQPMDIEDFLKKSVRNFSLSRKAYGRITLILNGVFNMARKQGLIEYRISDVLADIEFSKNAFTKTVKPDEERIFSIREEQIITEYLREHPDMVNLGLLLLFRTGLRIGELVALTQKDVFKDRIVVNKTETRYHDGKRYVCEIRDHPKTDAGIREVIIDSDGAEVLRSIKKLNPFGEYLFMKNGQRLKSEVFRRRLSRICGKTTTIAKKSPHKIRATYGTKLYDGGIEKSLICSQMGHTDVSCLEKNYYFNRMDDATKRSQIEKIMCQ